VKTPRSVPRVIHTEGESLKKLLICSSLALLTLSVSSAFAQNSNLYFNGKSQGSSYCYGADGCVDTGFLDGSINGVQVGPHDAGGPGMVCDDYQKNLSNGEQWTANGINVSSLNAGDIGADTLFGTSIGLKGYAELAFLVNELFTGSWTNKQESAFSQALWYLSGTLSSADLNATAKALVKAAELYVKINGDSLSGYSNLWLYASNTGGEMWGKVNVPEGGTVFGYVMLAGIVCFGSMFMRFRSKIALQK
jgi:hypothetical protein